MNNREGKIRITKLQRTKDDQQLRLDGAVLVRITNQGQTYLWIDEQEVLAPGESWVEGDLNGPGIYHEYTLTFLANASPPTADKPRVYSGNFANIRIFERHAGK